MNTMLVPPGAEVRQQDRLKAATLDTFIEAPADSSAGGPLSAHKRAS